MNGKFRVWNESLKQWVDPTVCFLGSDGIFFTFDGGLHKAAPHYKVVFSTGLHDKNGKEIWEGDIVDFRGYTGKVEWDDNSEGGGCWRIEFIDSNGGDSFYDKHRWHNIEVLGNVHENPELLKEDERG